MSRSFTGTSAYRALPRLVNTITPFRAFSSTDESGVFASDSILTFRMATLEGEPGDGVFLYPSLTDSRTFIAGFPRPRSGACCRAFVRRPQSERSAGPRGHHRRP